MSILQAPDGELFADEPTMGSVVKCPVCARAKKPVGRKPLTPEMALTLCTETNCDAYWQPPLPQTLWAGEKAK